MLHDKVAQCDHQRFGKSRLIAAAEDHLGQCQTVTCLVVRDDHRLAESEDAAVVALDIDTFQVISWRGVMHDAGRCHEDIAGSHRSAQIAGSQIAGATAEHHDLIDFVPMQLAGLAHIKLFSYSEIHRDHLIGSLS